MFCVLNTITCILQSDFIAISGESTTKNVSLLVIYRPFDVYLNRSKTCITVGPVAFE